jgi:hypothetical protein
VSHRRKEKDRNIFIHKCALTPPIGGKLDALKPVPLFDLPNEVIYPPGLCRMSAIKKK